MKGTARIWFSHKKISDDLYLIYEPYYYKRSRVNIWFIKGIDCNLLIDTGLGLSSLTRYIETFIDNTKQLKVVATDIHFDHTGGMYEFENCYIHESEYKALANSDQSHILSTSEYGYLLDDEFSRYPFDGFSAINYCVKNCPHVQPLRHHDIINLRNKKFVVIHLPGHSEGAIALYEQTSNALFSGDVVYDGHLLDDLPGSNIGEYLNSMKYLLKLDPSIIYPGHFSPFNKNKMISIVQNYIFGKNMSQ